MKSYLKTGIAAGALCVMCAGQAVVAQSGTRGGAFPQPVTRLQPLSAPVQNFTPQPSFVQQPSAFPSGVQQQQAFQTSPPAVAGGSRGQYDHRGYNALLQKYVDANGNVNYAAWQSNGQDRGALTNYLRGMNSVDVKGFSREGVMAFWINAYNALTIEGILRVYPTRSIKDHAPDASGFNIWDDFKVAVGGTQYSLNDIEHKVLRKMGDPRIHFAIVCASKSCPQLHLRAYFPEYLEQQLTHLTQLFFRTPGKFSYDLQRGQLGLSPIIQWFGEDFGRSDQERLQYLAQFMPAQAAQLAASGSASINYLEYDWGLNEAAVQSLPVGQGSLPVQSLRPQGSSTRQSVPVQGSSTHQGFQGQIITPSGSGSR